jgi:hypothetical protein
MGDTVLLLELRSHPGQFFTHDDIMIGLGEDPPHSFKSESVHYSCQVGPFFTLEDFEAIVGAGLFGLVQCLHDDPDTALVMRVFCVVAVEEGDTLLLVFAGHPVFDEILDLGDVHELHVIDVTVLLPLDDHIGRDTFVAHSLGVWLVVLTGAIYLVAHTRGRQAVIALDISRVHSLALQLSLLQPVVE